MNNMIKCPVCGHEFAVDEAFLHQAEERIKAEYDKKAALQVKNLEEQRKNLEKEKAQIEAMKERQEEILRVQLEKEKKKLLTDVQKQAREKFESELEALRTENEKQKKENKALQKKELELLRRENELKEKAEEIKIKAEKEALRQRDQIASEIRKREEEKNALKIKEYEKKLKDQKELIAEMNRKAEQGSMQMQGEVMELALEEFLDRQYHLDDIREVGKGQRGADVIQNVINEFGQNCGKIIYETKRTKSFGGDWIDKLKKDQREAQADIAVLVTETMPKDLQRFGIKDGVWVCSFPEVQGLSYVLREILIRTQAVKSVDENKNDKMTLLYNYLTSREFAGNIETIVESFSNMKNDIEKEKRAMQRIWKEREKQIERVIGSTVDMYASIKGIAGKSIATVKALELPGTTE